jgi:CRISPR-associated protein Csm2
MTMPIKEIETLMHKDESGTELVTFAQQTAKKLVTQNLTRSQIRSIFTEVRQIESLWPKVEALRRLTMLKPKLAYQTARSSSVDYLKQVLSEAIDEVVKAPAGDGRNERFKRFVDLFEAILAYHRAEGGKN